jgi:carbamoyltransferase
LRIQSVSRATKEQFWAMIKAFKNKTGCGVLANASFNVRGEPIVCTPEDAYACFMRKEMDSLVINDPVFIKTEQPSWREDGNWKSKFTLD